MDGEVGEPHQRRAHGEAPLTTVASAQRRTPHRTAPHRQKNKEQGKETRCKRRQPQRRSSI